MGVPDIRVSDHTCLEDKRGREASPIPSCENRNDLWGKMWVLGACKRRILLFYNRLICCFGGPEVRRLMMGLL